MEEEEEEEEAGITYEKEDRDKEDEEKDQRVAPLYSEEYKLIWGEQGNLPGRLSLEPLKPQLSSLPFSCYSRINAYITLEGCWIWPWMRGRRL